jgi:hypothetical protein
MARKNMPMSGSWVKVDNSWINLSQATKITAKLSAKGDFEVIVTLAGEEYIMYKSSDDPTDVMTREEANDFVFNLFMGRNF